MENEISNLKTTMVKLEANLKNFGDKLTEHIVDQKDSDKKVDNNFEEVKEKIDNLNETFQTRIGDKADQKEIIGKFAELDGKYAPRMAWQVMIWGGGVAGAIVIAQFIYLIGKSYLHLYR